MNQERERILAALGWEVEPRRRHALRRLLQDHSRRIYLQAYALTHNKAGAMDQARRTLLTLSRSLDRIPELCPLSAWIYLELQPTRRRIPECPEPWRLLAAPAEAGGETPGSDAGLEKNGPEIDRHREAHPGCRDLVEGYEQFLRREHDAELVSRSGWEAGRSDLDRFLEAQFGEHDPEAIRGKAFWLQLAHSFRWTRPRFAALGVVLGVIALAVILTSQWIGHSRSARSETAIVVDSTRTGPNPFSGLVGSRPGSAAPVTTSAPAALPAAEITGAEISVEPSGLTFRWEPSSLADQYRVAVLTAKLETLYTSNRTTSTGLQVSRKECPALQKGKPYLFRVDGMKGDEVVASSGYTPFTWP